MRVMQSKLTKHFFLNQTGVGVCVCVAGVPALDPPLVIYFKCLTLERHPRLREQKLFKVN